MSKKAYEPMASYDDLKRVEQELNKAQTVDRVRELVLKDGPKVGYKAFCYMLGGRMTAESMKPDEACEVAANLERQGKDEEAMEIYRAVVKAHPEHRVANTKVKG
jgi:hypothetical protein